MTEGPLVVLIGMMGSGKSTVGPLLAGRLGWRFADSDEWVERRAGRTVARIFVDEGEPRFRELEREAMAELLAQPETVVAAGGGWAAAEAAWNGLPPGARTVWLRAGPDSLQGRLRASEASGVRPLLPSTQVGASLEEMLVGREPYYARADLVVDTDDMQPAEVAGRLEALLKELL